MVSVSGKSVLKERLKKKKKQELQLGTSFQCLNLFTDELLHNQTSEQVDLKD